MPGLAPYKRVLQAGQRENIDARGTTIFLRLATGEISVTARSNAVGSKSGASYTLRMTEAERWFHAEEFDSIVIVDESGAANTIELYIGYGDFQKPVPDIVNVALTVPASRDVTTIADKINIDIGAAGKEQLAAINLDRTRAVITADAGNAEIIRVGDTNVDTDRGIPLAAGESLSFESTAAIFACSIATNDQIAAITEFTV